MPNVPETTTGPKTRVFGQLCVLFLAAGLIVSVVTKSLWPMFLFAAAIFLSVLFVNRFEQKEIDQKSAQEPRRGRPKA